MRVSPLKPAILRGRSKGTRGTPQELYEDLYIALSSAAAECYARCGSMRNAGLMRADVADALAARGEHRAAAELYEGQARLFLREAWSQLAAVVLPKLARCQKVRHPPRTNLRTMNRHPPAGT